MKNLDGYESRDALTGRPLRKMFYSTHEFCVPKMCFCFHIHAALTYRFRCVYVHACLCVLCLCARMQLSAFAVSEILSQSHAF